jgi:hypothetical protein
MSPSQDPGSLNEVHPEPLRVPDDKGIGEIEVPASQPDFDLSHRHQNFSSEILRLSLAGIVGIGFLIVNVESPLFIWE